MIQKLSRKDFRSVRLLLPGPARKEFKNAARKGTNLARKGKYSSNLTGRLWARASSNHYF